MFKILKFLKPFPTVTKYVESQVSNSLVAVPLFRYLLNSIEDISRQLSYPEKIMERHLFVLKNTKSIGICHRRFFVSRF